MTDSDCGPQPQAAVGVCLPRELIGQVAVLNDPHLPIEQDNVAHALQWIALLHNLRPHLAAGQHVAPQKQFVAYLQQRVIDLAIEKVLYTPPLRLCQTTALRECREHAAVPIRS